MTAHPFDPAAARERGRYEQAHHVMRTALTTLRSNVELVRHGLRDHHPAGEAGVQAHLEALDGAVDRLQHLAREMKAWHDAA